MGSVQRALTRLNMSTIDKVMNRLAESTAFHSVLSIRCQSRIQAKRIDPYAPPRAPATEDEHCGPRQRPKRSHARHWFNVRTKFGFCLGLISFAHYMVTSLHWTRYWSRLDGIYVQASIFSCIVTGFFATAIFAVMCGSIGWCMGLTVDFVDELKQSDD